MDRHGPLPSVWRLWAQPCPGGPDGVHGLHVGGYLRGHDHRGLDCDRPLLGSCRWCPAVTSLPCKGHRESRCKPCSGRYRRRLVRIAEAGLHDRAGTGEAGMLTLTGPGDGPHARLDWLTWKPGQRRPPCDCWLHAADGIGAWNATASGRWNRLRTALAREFPGLVFLRAVEVQDGRRRLDGEGRGALHLHVLLWTPGGVDPGRLGELALRAGFGCGTEWSVAEPGSARFAYYVAKYVTKACDARAEVPWTTIDGGTGEVVDHPGGRYRTWSASRATADRDGWGLTMGQVEAAVRAAARAAAARQRDAGLALLGAVEVDAPTALIGSTPDPSPD